MATNTNQRSVTQFDSDESSGSLDTCEMSPLSPHTELDRVDQVTTSGVKAHVAVDRMQRQMAVTDSPRSRKGGSWKWKFSIIGVLIVFIVVMTAAVSYGVKRIQCVEDRQKRILNRYKGLFMTEEEMQVKMAQMTSIHDSDHLAPVIESPQIPQYNCTMYKSGKSGATTEAKIGKTRDRDGVINHGCCETRLTFHVYDYLLDTSGVITRVVQFMDRFQYFYVEQCNHTMHCSLPCTCTQHLRYVTALVADDNLENERLESVVYFGSCKCINGNVQ